MFTSRSSKTVLVTVFGTSGDDAIALNPGRLADGTKSVAVSENGAVANIAVVGLLNIDLSQDGSDSLTVDRSITGYGHEVDLNVVGGGDKPDTMSVVATGTVPQTLTLSDGHVRADDAATGSELFLGRSDNIAIDQPKVTIEVIDTENGDASLGPATFSTFLLDTGATSILAAAEATLAAAAVLGALVFSWGHFESIRHLFYSLMLAFLAGMVGFVLSGDLFNIFVFLELMSVAAYALSGYHVTRPEVLQGALDFAVLNAIGTLTLEDGSQVKGFVAEPRAIDGARDITALGGWRAYMAQKQPA